MLPPAKLIFVPGAGCQVSEHYPKTHAALVEAGFAVTPLSPSWDAPFEQLAAEVEQQVGQEIDRHIGQNVLVLAHSRGANLVMPALVDRPAIGAIIASPSVTCAEGYVDEVAKELAEARCPGQREVVSRISMRGLGRASRIAQEHVAVLVGEREVLVDFPFMGGIAAETAAGFGVEVTQVPEAPHFVEHHENYVQAVAGAAIDIRAAMELSALPELR